MKAQDARSEDRRRSTNEWFHSTLYQRLNNKNTGAIIVVAQRLHVDDLVGNLQEHGTWKSIEIPAIAEETVRYEIGPGRFRIREPCDILLPELASRAALEQIRTEIGSYDFSAQYQQQPYPPGGNLIQREWLRRYREPPEYTTGMLIVQSWDPASELHDDASYSVCTTWAVIDQCYHLLHVLRERLPYPALKRTVIEHARRRRADIVLIERTSAGLPLIQDLQAQRIPGFRSWRPRGDKQARIAAQSAKFEAGKVFIPLEAPWLGDFLRELLSYPSSKHNDQVDSVSQFLEWIAARERRFNRIRPNPVRPRGHTDYYRVGRGWPNIA
jgi:predicted phage terminase large subunit-like protein